MACATCNAENFHPGCNGMGFYYLTGSVDNDGFAADYRSRQECPGLRAMILRNQSKSHCQLWPVPYRYNHATARQAPRGDKSYSGLYESARKWLQRRISGNPEGNPMGDLALVGEYGGGKTHLLAALANECDALCRSYCFAVVTDIYDALYEAARGNEEAAAKEAALSECEFLFLDDIAQTSGNKFGDGKLWGIINRRYNDRKPIAFSINEDASPPDNTQTMSVFSRLGEDVVKLEFPKIDLRKTRSVP